MNMNQIEGKWDQVKGKVREKWGKLTDDDLTIIKGQKDQLVGKIKERYGCAQEQAETEVKQFLASQDDSCGCGSSADKASNH